MLRGWLCALVLVVGACSPAQQQHAPTQPARPSEANEASNSLVAGGELSDVRTPAAIGEPTRFALGRVRLRLPDFLTAWTPPASVLELMGPRPGAVYFASSSPSLRMMISRDESLRQDGVPALCDANEDKRGQLEATGAALLDMRLVDVGGLRFCRIETLATPVVTIQWVGVVEGYVFVMAAFFDQAERTVLTPEIEAFIASFEYVPTQPGSECDPNEQAAMCPDDDHMAVCKDGHWTISSCDELCAKHGGTGDGCTLLNEAFACLCDNLPADAFDSR